MEPQDVDSPMGDVADGNRAILAMLEAARDIDLVLERRVDRIMGTLQMLRAFVLAAIVVFYQLVAWNPAPYQAALGPFLWWAWIAPVLAMRVVDAAWTASMERAAASAGKELGIRQWWVAPLAAAAVAVVLQATGHATFIAGGVLLVFGLATWRAGWQPQGATRLGRYWRATAGLYVALGIGLLFVHPGFAYLLLAAVLAAGGMTLGSLRRRGVR